MTFFEIDGQAFQIPEIVATHLKAQGAEIERLRKENEQLRTENKELWDDSHFAFIARAALDPH